MLTELIFASSNDHKAREIESGLPEGFTIITMKAAGILTEIDEPFSTIEENSRHKASTVYQLAGKDCFAEDTGLEVDFLNGEPGVKSARFAGEPPDNERNIQLLLQKMKDATNRKAQFKTVITLLLNGKEMQFTGICEGLITSEPVGTEGFGYDPVFIPNGTVRTFGQLKLEEKNKFSHRKKALSQMIHYLIHQFPKNRPK